MSTLTGHWYRGGTSKCWLFTADQISGTRDHIARALADAFGSSDPRQLEGVGGGTSTTSKAAIVTPSDAPGIDVSYLFAQIGIGDGHVEFSSNCGNCASAIALFALQQGMVAPSQGTTTVRLYNLNTQSVIRTAVATPKGEVLNSGDALIPGTSQTGVGVDVLFEDVDGTTTGTLFPTGKIVEPFELDGQECDATCIDAGAPSCFVSAEGSLGRRVFRDSGFDPEFVDRLIEVRTQASERMSLTAPGSRPSPAVPKTGVLGVPTDYRTLSGDPVAADEYDLRVTMLSMYAQHPAIGITSAVALVRSAAVQGTTAQRLLQGADLKPASEGFSVRLGTPSGVITAVYKNATEQLPQSVGVFRSSRHLADAEIHLPDRAPQLEGRQA